jgi:putative ABC transport system permease protein
MSTLWHDVRYAIRMFLKNPGFSAVAILTLALGIGTNTAIFSVVNAVLLRPLPFRDPARLAVLYEHFPSIGIIGPSYENLVDWRDQSASYEGVGFVHNATFTLTGAGDPQRLAGQMASANFFPLLGISPIMGHTFVADEDRAGGPLVALISYGFWQRQFGGSPDAIGKNITLDNQSYTVTGILPQEFQFFQPVDVMIPIAAWAKALPDDRSWHPGLIAVARLKPDATIDRAQTELSTIAKRLEQQYPVYDTNVGASVVPLHEQMVQNVRPALLVLLGAVGLVLLIACTNIANLLLARASGRRQEIAVRMAIGAGRARILRQLLTESVLLAIAGAATGLFFAALTMAPLVRLASTSIPNVGPITLDSHVLLFAGALAIFAGILFGLAPALQTSRLDLRTMLNEATRGSTGSARQQQVRSTLVVVEVAFALVLLIGAGLLIRSFSRLQDVQPGFQPTNILVVDVPVSPQALPKSAQRMDFFDNLRARAAALPGVLSVGAATNLPVSGGGGSIHFNIQGHPPQSPRDYILVGYRPVTPGYLETLHVPLLQGRLLTSADTENNAYVVVVNAAMAQHFFPGESALGKRVQLGATASPETTVPYMQIVGVVGNMKQNLATDPVAEMYMPVRQADSIIPVFALSYVLRTQGDPHTQISAFRGVLHDINPDQPLVRIRTMEENISTSVSQPRFRTVLLAIFAISALLLSVVGIYGLMAYSVSQRVHEVGIRIALGAQTGDVLKLIVGQGLKLVLIGVAVGLAGAFALSRILSTFLYQVTATDPITFGAVSVTLIAVAFIACYIPAHRATKVDPIVALRYE